MKTVKYRHFIAYTLMAAGVVSLAVLLVCGVAGFDGGDPTRLTVTRVCGSVTFIGVILLLGYRPYRTQDIMPMRRAWLIFLPALVVAVNNLPILPLITGEAVIKATSGELMMFAVESFFIGLYEETAFRRVLLLTVAERYGNDRRGLFLSAVAVSAVFGCAHLFNLFGGAGVGATLLQVSYSFLIGGMCSLVLLLTGSLAFCVLVHGIYDFCGYLVPRYGSGVIWTPGEIALTAAGGICVCAYYLYAARKLSPETVSALTKDRVEG